MQGVHECTTHITMEYVIARQHADGLCLNRLIQADGTRIKILASQLEGGRVGGEAGCEGRGG